MIDLVEIGSIRKTHGYAGEVKLALQDGFGVDVKNAEFLFIGKTPAKALPFELKALRGADWIVSFEGITSKEEAADLRGQNIYLRKEEITKEIIAEMAAEDVSQKFAGFAIIDAQLGEIAMIEEVVSYPQQELAKLVYKGQEVLVPLNQALITGVDFTKKIIFMNLPEGLLEL